MGNIEDFDRIALKYDTEVRIELADLCRIEIQSYIKNIENKKIIDLGCGTGLIGLEICKVALDVLLIDASKNMVDIVETKISKGKISNAHIKLMNLENERDLQTDCDVIIIVQVLLHIKDIDIFLEKVYNSICKGCQVIIIDYVKNQEVIGNKVHNGFEVSKLNHLLSKIGFKHIEYNVFYKGKNNFMNQDGELFILSAYRN